VISSHLRRASCCNLLLPHFSTTALFTNSLLKRILKVDRFVTVRSLIKHSAIRWLLLLAACLVVFFFAFHAKVGAYDHGLGAKPTPATASKLWVDGQKTEVPSFASTLIVLWFAVLLFYQFDLYRAPGIVSSFLTPAAVRVSLLDARRFLRPPPAC
jgi:hypothetical protein